MIKNSNVEGKEYIQGKMCAGIDPTPPDYIRAIRTLEVAT